MAFDPDAYLKGDQGVDAASYQGNFDPDSYLTGGINVELPQATATETATSLAAPAITGAAFAQPTGINPQAVKQGLAPMAEVIPRTIRQYTAPGGAVKAGLDLLGMSTIGVPPVASIETLRGVAAAPEAISKTASEVGKITGQSAMMTSPTTGSQYPSSVPGFRDIQRTAGPVVAQGMTDAYNRGGNNAVLKYLQTAPETQALRGTDDFAKLYQAYSGAVPSTSQQIGKVVKPMLRGAARVAGPAGLAYDIYEAAPYLAQGGQELQSGQAVQRMRQGRQALMNAPTPAPLTDKEVANLLASGDQRLINIYGGEQALQERIRRKAAQRVLAQ